MFEDNDSRFEIEFFFFLFFSFGILLNGYSKSKLKLSVMYSRKYILCSILQVDF